MDLDGSDPVHVISLPGPDGVSDLAIDEAGGKVYFTFGGSSANNTETVQRVNLDGSGMEPIATYNEPNALTARGIVVDAAAGHVFWIANGGCDPCPSCGVCSAIVRSDLNGANPLTVLTLTGSHNPNALTLDPASQLLYWGDFQNKPEIRRVTSTGMNVQPVYTRPIGSNEGVKDLALDLTHGKIYWLEADDNPAAIRVANLDGSSSVTVLSAGGGSDATEPHGLAVDPVVGKIYWTESGCGDPASGRIRRANLDGSGAETVKDGLGFLSAIKVVR
jgi:hypothetical protein